MAVVDVKQFAGTAIKSLKRTGVDQLEIIARVSVVNGNSIASIFRFAQVPVGYIVVGGEINTAGVAGCTDVDLGIYLDAEKGGTVKSVDALVDGMDLSSALAIGSGINPIADLGVDNIDKPLQELVSDGKGQYQAYVLALYLNAAATASGDFLIRLRLINGA